MTRDYWIGQLTKQQIAKYHADIDAVTANLIAGELERRAELVFWTSEPDIPRSVFSQWEPRHTFGLVRFSGL